jgi:Arc/MetJ-type ribon-helix-helix transcriptional regulator
MKILELEIPDQIAKRIESLVQAGWFASEKELVLFALSEFLSRYRPQVQEQFQQDDIRWALGLKADER